MYNSYGNDAGGLMALGFGMLFLILILAIGVTLLFVFYYKTLLDILTYIRPKNRETSPGNAMFMFIPLFNLIYGFIFYQRLSSSIKNEYKTLGLQEDGDFGKALGITLCALAFGFIIPFLNFLTPLASLVIWIILWVKLNGYKEVLLEKNADGFANAENVTSISRSTELLD